MGHSLPYRSSKVRNWHFKDVAAFTYIEDHELLEIKKRDTIIEIRNEYMLKSISIVEVLFVKKTIQQIFLHPKI
jgi:hypothetical protein